MIKLDVGYTRDIIRYCEAERVLLRQAAYILATTWHETAHTMRPIPEIGKGKGRPYAKPAGPYGHSYYGRGFVQLTWYDNYLKMSDILGVNCVKEPDLLLTPEVSVRALVVGMRRGMFTGKCLDDFINVSETDYVRARKIVNGLDRAEMIAGYAREYESLLEAMGYGLPREAIPVAQPAPPPPAIAQAQSKSGVTVMSWFKNIGAAVLGAALGVVATISVPFQKADKAVDAWRTAHFAAFDPACPYVKTNLDEYRKAWDRQYPYGAAIKMFAENQRQYFPDIDAEKARGCFIEPKKER